MSQELGLGVATIFIALYLAVIVTVSGFLHAARGQARNVTGAWHAANLFMLGGTVVNGLRLLSFLDPAPFVLVSNLMLLLGFRMHVTGLVRLLDQKTSSVASAAIVAVATLGIAYFTFVWGYQELRAMLFSLAMLGLIALAFAAIWRSRKGSLAPNLFPTVLFYALSGLLYLIWSSLPLWSGPTTDLRAVIGLHNSAYGLSATLILTGLTLSEFLLLYSQSLLREQTKSTLLTSLLDTVPDLVWMKDPQGAYVVFNRRLEESMGRKAEQILGKTDFELIGHERAVGAAELDASAIASGKLVKREVEVLFLNDQHTEIHEIIKAPVRSPDGQLLGVLGFGRDMTERLRSEQALKASEAWFQALIYQAPLAVSITQGSTIRHANRVFSAVLGLPCDESLTGRSIFEFLAESAHDAARQILKSFESGEAHAVRFETQGQRQDGSVFPVLIHAALVELPGEVAVLSFIQDLTTEKLAADREAQLQEHRVQAQKMESLGSLAGGIAHNINNTLAAILNLSSVSLTLVGEGSPAARHLNTIMRAVERGAKTVKSLLGFARQTPLELVAIDLENLIQGQIQLLQGIIPANIELRVVLLPGVPPIFGEPATLSTALMNLCVNALDAMPEGGTLTLSAKKLPDNRVEVVVADTGIGMSPEIRARALDLFFTTKPEGKGTGMGLALAYSTVKAHRGHLKIESTQGQGTRILMTFPSGPAVRAGRPSEAELEQSARSWKILVVDDDELVREALCESLRLLGHETEDVESGEAALARVRAGARPDRVILDLNMPGLGGRGTLPLLRELLPTVPVVLSTGQQDPSVLALASSMTQVGLLPKPYSVAQLQEALR